MAVSFIFLVPNLVN